MSYCTSADLKNEFGREELILLTKRKETPPDTINQKAVTRAINKATSEINVYLEGRYTLPLASTPAILHDIALDVARYFLHTRIDKEHPVSVRYLQRITTLKGIAKGDLSLGLDDHNAVAPVADTVQVAPGRNVFGGEY